MKKWFWIFLSILLIGVVGYVYLVFLERIPPSGSWLNQSEYLGRSAPPLRFSVSDTGRGLRDVVVSFRQGKDIYTLYSKDYSKESPAIKSAEFEVTLDIKGLRIRDGEGVITLTIRDRSLWNLGKGNTRSIDYRVSIDTVPPLIEIMSRDHVVRQGGSELAIYKVSPDTIETGIKIGDYFFKGYRSNSKDNGIYLAFFSYPYNLQSGKPVFIFAQDRAGNTFQKSLSVLVKPKPYKRSTIHLSKRFLEGKVPEVISFAGLNSRGDLIEDFILVNRELRKENEDKIRGITSESVPKLFWKGGFLQLRNAKVESNFADFRTYTFNGKVIDKEFHLGYDLAVTKRYPIEASNNGRVVFAGNMGIYGNTVIIDHGYGIFTLYSHMSSIDVHKGDMVEKGEMIGRTGDTGLAGGDHLHFGIYISGVPVVPLEWWDKKWVENRILRKMRYTGVFDTQ